MNLQLGNAHLYFTPQLLLCHYSLFDFQTHFPNVFLSSLEEIDASTFEAAFTKKKNYLNSNHKGGNDNSPETEEHSNFKFGNSASHFDPSSLFTNSDQFDYGNAGIFSNFVKQSNSQSINKQNWIHRKGYSLPKISSFVSLRDHNIVMSKHQLRQKAIGDVCLPECGVSDVTCNCGKLFTCVKQMDEYDLAVWAGLFSSWVLYYCETDYFSSFIFISLTAGGYVDKTPGSKNYGKFTVSAESVSTLKHFDLNRIINSDISADSIIGCIS